MHFKLNRLEFAYDDIGLISINNAEKGVKYYLDKERTIELVYCKGEKVSHYWRKVSNIPLDILRKVFGKSESIEHYNAKMQLSRQLTLFDEEYNCEFKFKRSETEYALKDINKIVDVAYFNEDDDLIVCLEVYHTNKKTTEDIKKFNQLENTFVYEYDINTKKQYLLSAGLGRKERIRNIGSRIDQARTHTTRIRQRIESNRNESERLEARIQEENRKWRSYFKEERKFKEELQQDAQRTADEEQKELENEIKQLTERMEGADDKFEKALERWGRKREEEDYNERRISEELECAELEKQIESAESEIVSGRNRIDELRKEYNEQFKKEQERFDEQSSPFTNRIAEVRKQIKEVEDRRK